MELYTSRNYIIEKFKKSFLIRSKRNGATWNYSTLLKAYNEMAFREKSIHGIKTWSIMTPLSMNKK